MSYLRSGVMVMLSRRVVRSLVPNCKWGSFKYKSLSATNLSIYLQKSKKYCV